MHQNIYSYSKEDIKELFIGLKENIFKNKNDYETYLGDKIFDFKLIGENSPFSEKIYWLRSFSGGVTSDYFQYVMLIKNSEASLVFQKSNE